MSRVPGAGDVRVISVDEEQWLFDPQPKGRIGQSVIQDSQGEEARVIDVMLPNHEIFGMTLPRGTEHSQFTDDQLVFMALACLEMRRSEEPDALHRWIERSPMSAARSS